MAKILIRKPQATEAETISELVLRSKAYWGYSTEFLASVRAELAITEPYLTQATAFVAEVDSKMAGFVGLSLKQDEIEFLFVDPEFIGSGVGKELWDCIIAEAKLLGLTSLKILSDPGAKPFYAKMGAKKIGMAKSSVRMLPLMEYRIC